MADTSSTRPTSISANATVTIQQRPSQLLMKMTLKAEEATLELQLVRLKQQREASTPWLKQLGAVRVEVGEPHFPDQVAKDPIAQARAFSAAMRRKLGPKAAEENKKGIHAVLTAFWNIDKLNAEEVLVLVDRLRFEATANQNTTEEPEEPTPWASPEEELRAMMSQMQQAATGNDDDNPEFFFISQISEEQRNKALSDGFVRAKNNAECLARAAGLRLGTLSSTSSSNTGGPESVATRMMERQRCWAKIAGSLYVPGEFEVISEDPRPAEFPVTVHVHYNAE